MAASDPQSPNTGGQPPRTTDADNSRRVDVTSKDSFPASDSPSWTPIVASHAPDELAGEDPATWEVKGETMQDRAREWARHAAELLDAARFEAYTIAHLTDDVLFLVGGDLQLSGRAAVREWLEHNLARAGRTTHRINSVTAEDNAIVVESEVTYVNTEGRAIKVAEACSYRLRGGRASRVHLYNSVEPRRGG